MSKIEVGTIPEGRPRERKLYEVWIQPIKERSIYPDPDPYWVGDADTLAEAKALAKPHTDSGWCYSGIRADLVAVEDLRRRLETEIERLTAGVEFYQRTMRDAVLLLKEALPNMYVVTAPQCEAEGYVMEARDRLNDALPEALKVPDT